jgi:hypothetical protein
MKDIVEITEGKNSDLQIASTEVMRATNLFKTEINYLNYFPEWGIDFAFFFTSDFKIQLETFKAYLAQRLGDFRIDLLQVIASPSRFIEELNFVFGNEERK